MSWNRSGTPAPSVRRNSTRPCSEKTSASERARAICAGPSPHGFWRICSDVLGRAVLSPAVRQVVALDPAVDGPTRILVEMHDEGPVAVSVANRDLLALLDRQPARLGLPARPV